MPQPDLSTEETFRAAARELFATKDALTVNLEKNRKDLEDLGKQPTGLKTAGYAGLGLLAIGAIFIAAPVTLLVVAAKTALALGAVALVVKAADPLAPAARRIGREHQQLVAQDLHAETAIAGLVQQMNFQSDDTRRQFTEDFNAVTKRREASLERMHMPTCKPALLPMPAPAEK